MSDSPKEFRLLVWPKANGDIYRVHNSYSFMMGQRCKKNGYIFYNFFVLLNFKSLFS